MTVLSDGEIIDAIDAGKILITPFNVDYLTPNGYDLCIGGIEIDGEMMQPNNAKQYPIPPLKDFRVVSLETIHCDAEHVAFLHLKTRHTRRGIQATFGKIDAGFNGTLTFGMLNSNHYYDLILGEKIVQIHFERLGQPAQQVYERSSGNYQHQKNTVMK